MVDHTQLLQSSIQSNGNLRKWSEATEEELSKSTKIQLLLDENSISVKQSAGGSGGGT